MKGGEKDPAKAAAAKERLKGDAEVDEFVREFGRVMGAHFEALGADAENENEKEGGGGKQQQQQQQQQARQSSGPRIQELRDGESLEDLQKREARDNAAIENAAKYVP